MTESPGSDGFGPTKDSEDQPLRIGGWVTRRSKAKDVPSTRPTATRPPKAVGRVVVTGAPMHAASATGGDQPVEVDRPAEPATPDPFLDEPSDQPQPRWWRHPAVARAGILARQSTTISCKQWRSLLQKQLSSKNYVADTRVLSKPAF